LTCENFEDLANYIKDKDEYKISCRFTNDDDFEFLFRLLRYERNVLLVVEECGAYISPRSSETKFLDLVNYGRHWNTYIIGISRRTAELSASMRAMTDVIYSFKQTEPMDLQKMCLLGFDGLENLEKFDYKKFNGVPVENIHYKKVNL
jgi:hypothetical protein